ncbi:MAG: hypothetical protein ACT4PJ_05310 [Gemmatimonadaceae bacterium]
MKRVVLFGLIAAALTALAAAVMTIAWPSPAEARAIWLSAGIALVVQVLAFGVASLMRREQALVGWGVGAIMRLAALAVYALVFVNPLGLPASAALMSLATFFFLSTLVEPLLLAP